MLKNHCERIRLLCLMGTPNPRKLPLIILRHCARCPKRVYWILLWDYTCKNIGYMVTKTPDVGVQALEFSVILSLFLAHRILRYSLKMSLGTTKMKYYYPHCRIDFPARTSHSFVSWPAGECNTWRCGTHCVVVVYCDYKFHSFPPIFYQQLIIQIAIKEFSR
jgi:hypothetical protein